MYTARDIEQRKVEEWQVDGLLEALAQYEAGKKAKLDKDEENDNEPL